MSPRILPNRLVIIPITPSVISIPTENMVERKAALPFVMVSRSLINETINGMLAKWQGLNTMLIIPQTKELKRAIHHD